MEHHKEKSSGRCPYAPPPNHARRVFLSESIRFRSGPSCRKRTKNDARRMTVVSKPRARLKPSSKRETDSSSTEAMFSPSLRCGRNKPPARTTRKHTKKEGAQGGLWIYQAFEHVLFLMMSMGFWIYQSSKIFNSPAVPKGCSLENRGALYPNTSKHNPFGTLVGSPFQRPFQYSLGLLAHLREVRWLGWVPRGQSPPNLRRWARSPRDYYSVCGCFRQTRWTWIWYFGKLPFLRLTWGILTTVVYSTDQ